MRLCRVHPGTSKSPLRLDLFTSTIADASGQYHALSYAWGSSLAPRWILLNGAIFRVQESLMAALRAIRDPAEKMTVWIDAICINQANQPEKKYQLSLMDQIYRNASNVLVWLGPEDEITEINIDSLSTLASGQISALAFSPGTIAAMETLCLQPYWNRAWIIQEILLARSVTIYFGSRKLPWEVFSSLLEKISKTTKYEHFQEVGFAYRISALRSRNAYQNPNVSSKFKRISLEDLLEMFSESKCYYVQDRIFSLLGLAKELDTAESLVDYSKDLGTLFFAVLGLCNPRKIERFAFLLQRALGVTNVDLKLSIDAREHMEISSMSYLQTLATNYNNSLTIQCAVQGKQVMTHFHKQVAKRSVRFEKGTKRPAHKIKPFLRKRKLRLMYLLKEADFGIRFRATAAGLQLEDFWTPDRMKSEDGWEDLDYDWMEWAPFPSELSMQLICPTHGDKENSPTLDIPTFRTMVTNHDLRSDPRVVRCMAIVLAQALLYFIIGSVRHLLIFFVFFPLPFTRKQPYVVQHAFEQHNDQGTWMIGVVSCH